MLRDKCAGFDGAGKVRVAKHRHRRRKGVGFTSHLAILSSNDPIPQNLWEAGRERRGRAGLAKGLSRTEQQVLK